MKIHLAIDLGAESGRVMAIGIDSSGKLMVGELHRFGHGPVRLPSGLHWDIGGLWREILAGLSCACVWARNHSHELVSAGVDCWGIDWALLDASGELLGLPHAYRDPRNVEYCRQAQERIPVSEIYQTTGIHMMPINTLYSLYALQCESPDLVACAKTLLFMPDLFHYWLSGQKAVEHSIASTSQMLDVHSGQWAHGMLQRLGMRTEMLGATVSPGTRLGTIREEVAAQTGLPRDLAVIAPASHDTASAVAGVPASEDSSWCFLSSGTWSLLGAELNRPCVTPASQNAMFTNEAGVGGTTRFLKNIAGMWLVQQSRVAWQGEGLDFSYAQLTALAGEAPPFRTIIDPNAPGFHAPASMLGAIADFARQTGQPLPETPAHFVRCALDSLALAYNHVLEKMESILGRTFDVIHIVGGGSQNSLLNQLTANATGRRVVPGPVEATAIGNGLVQAMACGELGSTGEIRQVIRDSGLVSPEVLPDEKSKEEILENRRRFAEICHAQGHG